MNTGGHFPTNLLEAGVDLILRRFRRLRVLLADLLLDKRAADQLLQSLLRRENAKSGLAGVQHRQPHLVVHVAGQDCLIVDHGHHPVKHHGLRGRRRLSRVLSLAR